MTKLNWDKAKHDSVRARSARDSITERPTGQQKFIQKNAKLMSEKQRSYILLLQEKTGTHEPLPHTAWQASNLIEYLKKRL